MGVLLAVVALDCGGVDALGVQQVVQEHAGAGAALAVDEADSRAGQIMQRLQVLGVAARDDQALLALGKVDEGDGAAG